MASIRSSTRATNHPTCNWRGSARVLATSFVRSASSASIRWQQMRYQFADWPAVLNEMGNSFDPIRGEDLLARSHNSKIHAEIARRMAESRATQNNLLAVNRAKREMEAARQAAEASSRASEDSENKF